MMTIKDFVEYHYNICANLVSDTKLKIPVMKIGDKYYVTKNFYYETPYLHLFRDGIFMPFDLNTSIKNMLYVFNDKRIYTDTLMTYYDPYGFGVVYPGEVKVYIPVSTTHYRGVIKFMSYFYPNIKETYPMFLEYKKSKNKNIQQTDKKQMT